MPRTNRITASHREAQADGVDAVALFLRALDDWCHPRVGHVGFEATSVARARAALPGREGDLRTRLVIDDRRQRDRSHYSISRLGRPVRERTIGASQTSGPRRRDASERRRHKAVSGGGTSPPPSE